MANAQIVDENTLKITLVVDDAVTMVQEAASHLEKYAHDIATIYEKMPEFDYTFFCFYAYDSAQLFENILPVDPKQYNSFSLDAPDAFFYTLYGGMAALYEKVPVTSRIMSNG
ncbi:hypothetical protein JNUCC1_00800 [Lentibacillus sp. JNUCC-1]|uniref:hypothetical protein n=1 Tax=Lentibacillus sp. JNUCC-1 TaxID=2654513 RepID=UPI0012E92D84|nr:hypothetical protein [Lentibacillus sp. JNUCC-1]MUV36994.1 hypothetical protein [Lentibacillus sp. JNUCC-1]